MSRPRKSTKDKNHNDLLWVMKNRLGGYERSIFVNEKGQSIKGSHAANLQGLRVLAYDTADAGNEMLDWVVHVSWFVMYLEVKVEREVKSKSHQRLSDEAYYRSLLKKSERVFMQNCLSVSRIVYSTDMIYELLHQAADFVFYVDDGMINNLSSLKVFFPKLH